MNNSVLDDIGGVIGYTPTRKLALAFGGRRLSVPHIVRDGHPLAVLIGLPAFRALVREFSGVDLFLPTAGDDDRFRRDLVIAERLAAGATSADIALEMAISVRRVEQIRCDLGASGWIRYSGGHRRAMVLARLAARGAREAERPTLEILGTGEVFDDTPLPLKAAGAA